MIGRRGHATHAAPPSSGWLYCGRGHTGLTCGLPPYALGLYSPEVARTYQSRTIRRLTASFAAWPGFRLRSSRRNVLQVRFGPPGQLTGRVLPMHHSAAWLYWGQNEVIPEDFTSSVEPHYTLDYALAKWRIPGPLNRIAQGAGAPYEIRGANGRFGGHWGDSKNLETLRYVWRDQDFAIGGPVAQLINPSGFLFNYVMFGIT